MNKNKIVVRVQGGLGNQMFQYAYTYAVSKKNGSKGLLDVYTYEWYKVRENQLSEFKKQPEYALKSDLPFYERIRFFNSKNIISRILKSIFWRLNPYDYRESSKGYESQMMNISKGYVIGYFQSDKYFRDIEDEIRNLFIFKDSTESKISRYISKNNINMDNFVLLHIRRGDFQTDPNVSTVPIKYSFEAIDKYFKNYSLLICSDDVNWCKENFKEIKNQIIFVENLDGLETLCLMSKFKNYIISNSTFSWRGAYLSKEENKKIVRPDLKFDRERKGEAYCSDHYPESWIPLAID